MSQTDAQVAAAIGSRDKTESFEAAKEAVRRGERMIWLLLRNKGNTQHFAWGSLGDPNTSEITFGPGEDPEWDKGRIITVEVTSIYLISAIYYDKFEFGETAYLRNGTYVKSQKFNTDSRVRKSWVSVEHWVEKLQREGLASLRAKKIDPLAESGFSF